MLLRSSNVRKGSVLGKEEEVVVAAWRSRLRVGWHKARRPRDSASKHARIKGAAGLRPLVIRVHPRSCPASPHYDFMPCGQAYQRRGRPRHAVTTSMTLQPPASSPIPHHEPFRRLKRSTLKALEQHLA